MKKFDYVRLLTGIPLFLLTCVLMILCAVMPLLTKSTRDVAVGCAILEIVLGLITVGLFYLVRTPYQKWKARSVELPFANESARSYATVGQRVLAGLIDSLLFSPLIAIHYLISDWSRAGFFAGCCLSALYYPYLLLMVGWRGQTVGKMTMGIRILRTDGTAPDMANSFRRSSIDLVYYLLYLAGEGFSLHGLTTHAFAGLSYPKILAAVSANNPLHRVELAFLLIWVAGEYVSMLFNRRRRAIHDLLGGTVVVKTRA